MSKFEESHEKSKTNNKNHAKTQHLTSFSAADYNKLSNLRIIQKNLVYVIGLADGLALKDTLIRHEYFGQYGKITKLIVNKTKAYNASSPNGPSYSAYVSYQYSNEAALAILAVDNIIQEEHTIRATFGTTKYCSYFLKNLDCPNKDCLYLHSVAPEGDIISKDDMNNKNVFQEQQKIAIEVSNILNKDVQKKLKQQTKKKTVFPSIDSIFSKDLVKEKEKENEIKNTRVASPRKERVVNKEIQIKSNSNRNLDNIPHPSISPEITIKKTPFSLFEKREKSRFPFAKSTELQSNSLNCSEEGDLVPQYVFDVITKNIKRHSFFKKFENEFFCHKKISNSFYVDKLVQLKNHYLTKSQPSSFEEDTWSDFIKNNLNLEISLNTPIVNTQKK
jgi:hypothetical protein